MKKDTRGFEFFWIPCLIKSLWHFSDYIILSHNFDREMSSMIFPVNEHFVNFEITTSLFKMKSLEL